MVSDILLTKQKSVTLYQPKGSLLKDLNQLKKLKQQKVFGERLLCKQKAKKS